MDKRLSGAYILIFISTPTIFYLILFIRFYRFPLGIPIYSNIGFTSL
nr:MAG TPA: Photosystem II protein D1 [Caudoviricetes sp.]